MRRTLLVWLAVVGIAMPCAVAACGAPQEAPAAAPIVVEPTAASASPAPPPDPVTSAVASAAPPASAASVTAPPDDPIVEKGNMWGDAIGDAFGAGGLGLYAGDAGTSGAIGVPQSQSSGSFGRGHSSPALRQGVTTVNGRLPPEVIQRIVRQNFGRYRLCYENGLRTNPKLSGRIAVSFVIDQSGAVKSARDGGSDLPDKGVVSCVVRGFANLSFPQPEKGEVSVTYPIIFIPGDPAPAPSGSTSSKPPAKK